MPYLGADVVANPDLLANPATNHGWLATLSFYMRPDFNCMGTWVPGVNCQVAGRTDNIAAFTWRINGALECVHKDGVSRPSRAVTQVSKPQQVQRVDLVNSVRVNAFGLPPITDPSKLYC